MAHGHSRKMIGKQFSQYRITKHLGSGGMGDVYQAEDLKLGRSVAIKFLPPPFIHDTERISRFHREARVLASLNHPNIAAIYGTEESEGQTLLILELVPGAIARPASGIEVCGARSLVSHVSLAVRERRATTVRFDTPI